MGQTLDSFTSSYFIRQVMVILCLYATGLLLMGLLEIRDRVRQAMYALPVGVSLWGVAGFFVLVFNIPFRLSSIIILYIIIFAALIMWNIYKKNRLSIAKADAIFYLMIAVAALVIAVICCSGFVKISLSNDSYYYYSVYPQTLVNKGEYITAFDVFLTDVGQTTAIINTLPWLLGFEETYGIQLMMGINLLVIYGFLVYVIFKGRGVKFAFIASAASSIFLAVSTPFVVMTRWVLANAYFMSCLFALFSLVYQMGLKETKDKREIYRIVALLFAMLSMMRMEGGMIAGLLVLCACAIDDIDNKDIFKFMVLPIGVTQLAYYIIVFYKLTVNPLYSFLSFTNAIIMMAFVVALIIYVCIIRKHFFDKLLSHYDLLFVGGLIAGNAVICAISPERYLGNIKFMILNIYQKNGWGVFGFCIAAYIIVLLFVAIIKKSKWNGRIPFDWLFVIGFVLFTIAVCWARDGSLRLGIGDSGNRVLMQIVPFVVFAVTETVAFLI